MKRFIQFLSESDNQFNDYLSDLLKRLKGTKLVDPKTGMPQPLYHATNASSDFSEFNLTPSGTFGKAVYLSPDRNEVQSYLNTDKRNMNWQEYHQKTNPSVQDELRAGAVFPPNSRVITAYGKSENPFIFGEEGPEFKGDAFKKAIRDRFGLKMDPRDFKTSWNDFMGNFWKKTGHDSIVYRGNPMPEIAIPDPKNVIISPDVTSPKAIKSATNIPGGARRGAVSADTLATLAGVGSGFAAGAVTGTAMAMDNVLPGLLTPPPNRTRQTMEKMFNSDAGLAFDVTPDGELEANQAGMKAVRDRQKKGVSFPSYYP